MTAILPNTPETLVLLSVLVVLLAGFVKGAVGFGMPMILISGIGSFMPAEIAIAGLILPTVFTNLIQAFRGGYLGAARTFRKYWLFNSLLFVMIFSSAQLVSVLPRPILFILLGAMIIFFTSLQLLGWKMNIRRGYERLTEVIVGAIAGGFGGLTGVWGPPTILYLTALNVPKDEHIRAQGVVYLAGAVLLTAAHVKSGILNADTVWFSALLVIPALVGQAMGLTLHRRMDQAIFAKATLVVLLFAGLNLMRRGLIG